MPATVNILIRAVDQASRVINQVGNNSTNLSARLNVVGSTMTKVGSNLTKGVTLPLLAVAGASTKAVATFDDSMSRVQAISGATGGEIIKLRDLAKDLGSTTRFAASEAADAMGFLALAGWDANQILEATPQMLSLASAGSMDLAQAADIVTDTMTAFKMSAEDAGKASDIFAAAQAKSNTSIAMLGEAMKYSSANAASAEMSLAQTAAVMGVLADSGIKGSMAGTTFNAMLRDLKTNSDEGAVSIGKMKIAIYESNGSMRDLGSIMADIEGATKNMTTAQRDAALGEIFMEQSIRGVNVMLSTGSGRYKELETALNNSQGAADKMAATMEDNVGGSFRELKSQLEGVLIQLGEQLAPILINNLIPALQNVGDKVAALIEWYASLGGAGQAVVNGVIAFMVVIGPLVSIIGMAINVISFLSAVLPVLGGGIAAASTAVWGFTAALLANPITWIVIGIIALIAAIVLLIKNWDTVSAFLIGVWEKIKEVAVNVWDSIVEFFASLPEKVSDIFNALVEKVIWIWENFTPLGIIVSHWDTIIDFFKSIPGRVVEIFNQVIEFIKTLPYWFGFIVGRIIRFMIELPPKLWDIFLFVLVKVGLFILQMELKALELGKKFLDATIKFFKELPGNVWNWLKTTGLKVAIWILVMELKAIDMGKKFLSAVIDFFKQLPGKVWGFLVDVVTKVINWAVDMDKKAKETGKNVVDGFINVVKSLPGKVWDVMLSILGKIKNAGSMLLQGAKDTADNIWQGFKDGLGIHSPSYLERAMDDIIKKSYEMKDDIASNFNELRDIGIPNYAGNNSVIMIEKSINSAFENQNQEKESRTIIEVPVNLDGREVSRVITPYVSKDLAHNTKSRVRAKGGKL